MAERIYYPIGEQDFKSLRNDGCIYIDKTPFIAKILVRSFPYA
ncbi:MAG: AAA family ATPase [Muribaculum sp.]|nr:AAA family ATPase [Muribaculum sp.]